jgi:hypothetical protein
MYIEPHCAKLSSRLPSLVIRPARKWGACYAASVNKRKTSFIQDHLADCENSVCQGCQLRLTTVPSEHKCRDETEVFRCPLIKIGCTAGKFVSFSQSDVHVA